MPDIICPRVQQHIECPECGYPASEAQYYLESCYICDEGTHAVEPLTNVLRKDPGHKE